MRQPKLRMYRTFKTKLQIEPYLLTDKNKRGRYLFTGLRTGSNQLRIETGRWKRPQEHERERVCMICMSGEIEDERHFILDCTSYEHLREEMYARIQDSTNIHINNKTKEEIWQILMNNEKKSTEIYDAMQNYVRRAIRRREKI